MDKFKHLKDNQIHLWSANLDVAESEVKSLVETLSADEKTRAERFRFEHHRKRFIVARGLLRRLLGSYLGVEATRIRFDYNPTGKPRIAGGGIDRLEFNISHSQDLALYGFTLNRPIGVDLEYLRDFEEVDKIAQRFFSPQEYQVIKSLAPEQQQEAFFRAWTGKEAYLKATGEGLSGGLDKIEIELKPKQPAKLISINNQIEAAANWCLYEIIPAPNYLGAIAVETRENLELQRSQVEIYPLSG